MPTAARDGGAGAHPARATMLRLAAGLLAALAALAGAACGAAAQSAPSGDGQSGGKGPTSTSAPSKKEVSPMSGQQVAARVRAKDWSFVDEGAPIAPQAVPDIAALMSSTDHEVRELATHALNAAGGPAAAEALIKALSDPNDIVRGNAVRFLHNHATAAHVPIVIRSLRTHTDEYVREQSALLLGKLGNADAAKALNEQIVVESFPEARQAMSLALVKLGDEKQTEIFAARFKAESAVERVGVLEDLLYVSDRKFVPDVLPLLSDTRDGKNVGPSHGRYYIRVCDVAINVLDVVLKKPFPFTVARVKRYSGEELGQASKALAKVK